MSTLDINSIRDYLIEVGCKVEYPILVNAFKRHLYNPDPSIQSTVRTQFKDYVNRLSTVNVENNMKFITLRPEFRPAGQPAMSPPQDGRVKMLQKQAPQHPQTPPPMMASSPKRPQPPSTNTSKQTPVAAQPREPAALPPLPPLPMHLDCSNLRPENDRLDKSRVVQMEHMSSSSSNNNNFQSPIAQPPQPRRQHAHQSTPRPPVVQHHRLQSAPVMENMEPHQVISCNPTSRVQISQETVDRQPQQYSAPPEQQHPRHHYRSQSQPVPGRPQQSVQQSQPSPPQAMQQLSGSNQNQDRPRPPLNHVNNNGNSKDSILGSDAAMMPPPPVPPQQGHRSPLVRQSSSLQKLDTMPPPRPPPRRRQSTASLYGKPTPNKSIDKNGRDMQDMAYKGVAGRLRDQAHRSYSSASTNDLSPFMAKRNSSMKENRLSRESNLNHLSSSFQSISFNMVKRSRSSHRGEDESDSSSLQPNDPLRRKWTMEASSCNYNNLLLLLREDPKLAFCKDVMNGYTSLHWAAKFGNLEIIRLIAGTYGVSVNIRSSAGQTPLHVAYMFNRMEAVHLLLQSYQASTEVRDHSGKRPRQYMQAPNAT